MFLRAPHVKSLENSWNMLYSYRGMTLFIVLRVVPDAVEVPISAIVPVSGIVRVIPAGAYRRYRGTTTVWSCVWVVLCCFRPVFVMGCVHCVVHGFDQTLAWQWGVCDHAAGLFQKRCTLPCLVFSCFVLSCLVLSCLVLSCLVLSCLVLSCLVLSCLARPWFSVSCFVGLDLVCPCVVFFCLVAFWLCRVLSCVVDCVPHAASNSFLFFVVLHVA